ncbi:diguanylate cyclase [Jeotgalibacillus sp. ET6]|uniref:diguanylate cyclase n=1 Tax=Jeotgalibacillus sp. ET6 TaxID=3037260 RepID=UPI00241876BC|nr:diguanylate cyclase [Jeotgalibacillus sp. ET6]MDG5472524.1 diguanylate cyclase [Jeotgalibacillus sp. ET6]
MIEDLFVNLCILITLLFTYLQIRWKCRTEEMYSLKWKWLDGIAAGTMGNVLMYFSIPVNSETIVDLRYIPIMLTFLFLGVYPSVVSSILIILGRFIFGVNVSSLAALFLILFIFAGFYLIVRSVTSVLKRTVAMVVHANIMFSIILLMIIPDWESIYLLILLYWLLSAAGGFASMFFVKYIMKSHYLLAKYETESGTDFLTGLSNTRQFSDRWAALILNAKQKNESISLLMIDIDYFKFVNDTYGHPAGDLVLKELGQLLKHSVRSFDIVSRNGGEEFSVILLDSSHQKAAQMAEEIRSAVEAYRFKLSPEVSISITISIGIATFPDKVKDSEQMKAAADKCLYKAKQSGRNKVCM